MVQILRNSHGHPFFRSKRRHSRSSITMKHGGDPGDIDVTRTRLQLPGGRPVNSSSNWGAPAFPWYLIGPLQCSLLILKAYSLAKLGVRPSYAKWHKSEHSILTSNYVDRYNQLADTFLCFMVLVEVLTHWSRVTLLSTAYVAYTSTGSLPIL